MLTVQQMLGIASRHMTRMADAMVAACVAWLVEHGEPIDVPEGSSGICERGVRPAEDVDWERMVRGNSDSRWQHV